MERQLIEVAININKNMSNLLTNTIGASFSLSIFILNFFSGYEIAIIAVGIAIFFDFFFGVWASVKKGTFLKTKAWGNSFIKILIYGSVIIIVRTLEFGIHEESYLTTKLVCSFATGCELWSIMANILIIKPDMPFISLLRKSLANEIADKLHIDKSEVEDELNKRVKKRNKNSIENESN